MNPLSKQAIQNFLSTNNLNPQERPMDDGGEHWLIDMAENLQSELFCYEASANDITALVMTSVQIPESDNATTLAAAISPALAPATIMHIGEILTLRLMIRGEPKAIGGLLEESILISRHIMASVFPRVVELAEGKIPMQNAMILAMQALQGGNAAAANGDDEG